jgi:hypothetical protein
MRNRQSVLKICEILLLKGIGAKFFGSRISLLIEHKVKS